MSVNKPKKKVAAKNNPLLQGHTPLAFDNIEEDQLLELTNEQEEDLFMATWMETMRPFSAYRTYFSRPDVDRTVVLHHVKKLYTRFVTEGDWTDDKYLVVVDAVLVSQAPFTIKTLEAKAPLYDEEKLPLQVKEKRKQRRRL